MKAFIIALINILKCGKSNKTAFELLNIIPYVQECDATKASCMFFCPLQKTVFVFIKIYRLCCV